MSLIDPRLSRLIYDSNVNEHDEVDVIYNYIDL